MLELVRLKYFLTVDPVIITVEIKPYINKISLFLKMEVWSLSHCFLEDHKDPCIGWSIL